MSHLAAGSAAVAAIAEKPAELESELAAADRDLHEAVLEKAEIEERLRALRAQIGARLSELAQQEHVAYFDGWAPRDLPLLPSPIHRVLISADELAAAQKAPLAGHSAESDNTALRELPQPGSLPSLDYLPAWKRPFAAFFGRLLLLVGGFLSLPQRTINEKLVSRLLELEKRVDHLTRDRDQLIGCLELLGRRSIENFTFLDQCDRDRLLELHRKAEELRSEWRGDLERSSARLSNELTELLDHKAPGHRLGLLELELASAETKITLARQRREIAELRKRLSETLAP